MNISILWEEESIKEVKELLNSVEYYLDGDGEILYNPITPILDITTSIFTEDKK